MKAGWYVALLIDVLGQQKAILNAPPFPETEGEKASYLDAIRDTAGKVVEVRQLVSTFFHSYFHSPPSTLPDRLTSEQRAQYDILNEWRLGTQMFCDTVIAFAPLPTRTGQVVTRGAEAMMWAAISTLIHSLSEGIALRGAIDVNDATELHDNDLYGRVVLNVHRLEKNVAQWPRIVVGEGLLKFLGEMRQTRCSDLVGQMNCKMAERCLRTITPDVDGVPILDYLGSGFQHEFGCILAQDTLSRCLAFVRAEHERFSQSGDYKHALRYSLLRQYYETNNVDSFLERSEPRLRTHVGRGQTPGQPT